MNVNAKEKYLLGLLTDIKREIICQDVLRENQLQTNGKMDWYRFTDRTKDKVLTVLFILMGDDIPNGCLYTYRDYSVFYGTIWIVWLVYYSAVINDVNDIDLRNALEFCNREIFPEHVFILHKQHF